MHFDGHTQASSGQAYFLPPKSLGRAQPVTKGYYVF
jgi:hypothetical protein